MSIFTAKATFTARVTGRTAIEQLGILVKITAAVQRAQRVVADHARDIVPVDTGELQSSITTVDPVDDFQSVVGGVVATAEHAGFVEFGTGIRGMGTYPGDLPQEGVPITGNWSYDYKRQNWKGHAAQPYMRPALDAARSEVLEAFRS